MPAESPKSMEMLAPVIGGARRLGQEPDQFGDLRRLDEARRRALRVAAQQLVEVRRRIGARGRLPAQHRRVDIARAHRVDTNRRAAPARAPAPRVRLVTPPFDAQYTAAPALPCTPASDDMLTMQPPVAARWGMAAEHTKYRPLRLRSITPSHSCSVVSSLGPSVHTPAALTTASRRLAPRDGFGDRSPAVGDGAKVGDDRQQRVDRSMRWFNRVDVDSSDSPAAGDETVGGCAADAAGGPGDQRDGRQVAGRHERSSGSELPPSTTICWAVTKLAVGSARKRTAAATSSGVPLRPSGV